MTHKEPIAASHLPFSVAQKFGKVGWFILPSSCVVCGDVCTCVRACLDRGRLGGVVRSQPARWRMIYTSSLAAPGWARRYKGCARGRSVQCCQLSCVIETLFVKLTLKLEVISACLLSRSSQCVWVLYGMLLTSAKYPVLNYDDIVKFNFCSFS
jgi:hypothetical protein